MRQLISQPDEVTFDASAGTVTLTGFTTVTLGRLLHILNVTRGVVLYDPYNPTKLATVTGNTITLATGVSAGHDDADVIQVVYESAESDPQNQTSTIVSGARRKFRDSFASVGQQPNPAVWDVSNPGGHLITVGGNSSGSKYLRISMNPLLTNSEVRLTSKETFGFPFRAGFGMSLSQRVWGQEFAIGIAADNGSGEVDYSSGIPDLTITGSTASVTSNVVTFTVTDHGLNGGDRVVIYGCADSRLNAGPISVTTVDSNTFTIPLTLSNGSYSTVGGKVFIADPLRGAVNGAAYVFENTSFTQANLAIRRNGAKFRQLGNQTVGTTVGGQTNTNAYTDAWNSGSNYEIEARFDELSFRSYAADSTLAPNVQKLSQVPEEESEYHLVIRARNHHNLTAPIGRVVSAAKSGTATMTIVTDVPHGLTTADTVALYGTRDLTNFPNTASTAVTSVVSSTSFTVSVGTSVTASTSGGVVWRIQGGIAVPGVYNVAVVSMSRTNNVLSVVANTTWATPLPGEYVYLHGLDNAAQYEGGYKVLRVSTSTLELESVGADFTSISTGGVGIRMTDMRVHFTRVLDYTRHVVEVSGGRGNTSDINNAVPVTLAGTSPVSISAAVAVTQSTGSTTTTWQAAGFGGRLVADQGSSALTSTTTTSAITPGDTANVGVQAHSFSVIVTAVSGTNPTFDLVVQESFDNGTNWIDIYHFERITATGQYVSPQIPATWGTRYRYVQTVTGTSPSFTRAINRIMFSHRSPLIRRFFDRTVAPNTLNSATPSYNVEGCRQVQLTVLMGAITTTAPVWKLQGSEDNSNWYDLSPNTINPAASSSAVLNVLDVAPKFVRAVVASAGSGATLTYVNIKGLGY